MNLKFVLTSLSSFTLLAFNKPAEEHVFVFRVLIAVRRLSDCLGYTRVRNGRMRTGEQNTNITEVNYFCCLSLLLDALKITKSV